MQPHLLHLKVFEVLEMQKYIFSDGFSAKVKGIIPCGNGAGIVREWGGVGWDPLQDFAGGRWPYLYWGLLSVRLGDGVRLPRADGPQEDPEEWQHGPVHVDRYFCGRRCNLRGVLVAQSNCNYSLIAVAIVKVCYRNYNKLNIYIVITICEKNYSIIDK